MSDFEYIKISELPQYWQMKIEGAPWYMTMPTPRCPYDGSTLIKKDEPIKHKHCNRCNRNYA